MHRAKYFLLAAIAAHPCLAQVTRLLPSAFPELPRNLVADLLRRGCTIPQVPMVKSHHNVIKGQFARPGQMDWAVLCSINQSSSILIFWNGSEENPAQIESKKDEISVQSWTDHKMVFSRKIDPVGKSYMIDHYKAYGGEKPPPIDHQGIDDEFYGKASVVLYLYQGKWFHLSGSD